MNIKLKKKKIISKIIKKINTATVILLAKFSKIKTNQLTYLRKISKKKNIFISVFKNTLLKRALEESKFKHLISKINGQIICFISNNIILVSKLINNFLKINSNLIVKIGSFLGKEIFFLDIKKFANIPDQKTLIIRLLNILKYSIINFVKILFFLKNKNK